MPEDRSTEHPILELLGSAARAVSARTFPSNTDTTTTSGLYSWWADAEARAAIGAALQIECPPLIYLGQAGAGVSSATLASRIRGNHIGGNIRASTFRHTITAILNAHLAENGLSSPPSPLAVTEWIKDHLSVAVVSVPNRAEVAAAEDAALERFDPPLNLKGMPATDSRRRLRQLRKAVPRRPRAASN